MSSIFAKLREKKQADVQSITEAYHQWLSKLDPTNTETTEAEAEQLHDLLRRLDKTPDDAAHDHAVILQARHDVADLSQHHDADQVAHKLNEDYLAACKVRQETTLEQNAAVTKASMEKDAAAAEAKRIRELRDNVRRLRDTSPHVYNVVRPKNDKKLGL